MLLVQPQFGHDLGFMDCNEPLPPWVRTKPDDAKKVCIYDLLAVKMGARVELCAVLPFYPGGGPVIIQELLRKVPANVHVVVWWNFVFDLRRECTTEELYHAELEAIQALLQSQHLQLWPPLPVCNYWADKATYFANLLEANLPIELLPTWVLSSKLSAKEKEAALQEMLDKYPAVVFKRGYSDRSECVVTVERGQDQQQVLQLMQTGGGLLQEFNSQVQNCWEYRVYVTTHPLQVLFTVRTKWTADGRVIHVETVNEAKLRDHRQAVEQAALKTVEALRNQHNGPQLLAVMRCDLFYIGRRLVLNEIEYLGNCAFMLMDTVVFDKLSEHVMDALFSFCPDLLRRPALCLLRAGPRKLGIPNPDGVLCHMIAAVQVCLRTVLPWTILFNPAALKNADSVENKQIVHLLRDVATVRFRDASYRLSYFQLVVPVVRHGRTTVCAEACPKSSARHARRHHGRHNAYCGGFLAVSCSSAAAYRDSAQMRCMWRADY